MTVRVRYFAQLREQRGLDTETVETSTVTPLGLYAELQALHGFRLPCTSVKAAVNGSFASEETVLGEGDEVVFVPPVSGG